MRQVLQSLGNGEIELADVPCPSAKPGHLLIQSRATLISAGTERMLMEFGKASLLEKARQQPDKVREVMNKMATDGVVSTLQTVRERLDQQLPLGYCNAGVVLDVGTGVSHFHPGDRVVSNGSHAEIVCVPKNLCAKIPDGVSDEEASFTVLSSIGLQGVRLVQPTLGENIVVYGLGLIGLLTVQLLRASGCNVLGVDLNPNRLAIAQEFGASTVNPREGSDPTTVANSWTGGEGVDGVLVTAAAKTDEIMHQAAQMCRKRGRIVLIGVVGLNLQRSDFYEKELTFQVSCSYGPGRYDEAYEQQGQDYPRGFVRWTEQRNFEAVLDMLASCRLNTDRLTTHRFPFTEAGRAYEAMSSDPLSLGIVMQYHGEPDLSPKVALPAKEQAAGSAAVLGVMGTGNFTKATLLPALAKTEARIGYISASVNGANAKHLAKKYGADNAVTDYRLMLHDDRVQAVLIATQHHLHARFIEEALQANKHVFVEKPLAMNVDEVAQVIDCVRACPDRQLMVGFNRRFSPHTLKIQQLLQGRSEPLAMTMTINAGMIPPSHWVQDPAKGGGRIVGEACHFIDLMACLADAKVQTVSAIMMGPSITVPEDKMAIALGFEDGSVGTINYFANGSKAYPKEQLEVFSEGRVLRLENFRRTTGFGFSGFRKFTTRRLDKGHEAELANFVERISQGGEPLISLDELVNVTLASFAAVTAARENRVVNLDDEYALSLRPQSS